MKHTHKPRLVVITGAGASVDRLPTAEGLTHACLIREPFVVHAERCVQHTLGKAYTFEDVLEYCLTALDSSDTMCHVSDVSQAAERYFHSILDVMLAGLEPPNPAPPLLATMLDVLSTRFSLTLATLNWDDIPLDADVPWYSGFAAEGPFEARYLNRVDDFEHRVLWLHGSLHFSTNPPSQLVWLDNRQSIRQATLLSTASYSGTSSNFRGPIITGKEKRGQIMRRPFLDYRVTLYRDLLEADSLLIIGYRGDDVDLNEILHAALLEDVNHHVNIVRIDYSEYGQDMPEIFEWLSKTCGNSLRFCAPALGEPIRLEHGLVRISDARFGNSLPQVTASNTYISLGGLESASENILQIADALREPKRNR